MNLIRASIERPSAVVAVVLMVVLFGFVACVLPVLAATEMRKVLMRRDNYYDDDDR